MVIFGNKGVFDVFCRFLIMNEDLEVKIFGL